MAKADALIRIVNTMRLSVSFQQNEVRRVKLDRAHVARLTSFIFLILALGIGELLAAQKEKIDQAGTQLFTENEQFKNIVPLPAKVRELILERYESKQARLLATDSELQNPEQWFRATEIHLAQENETELMVMGIEPMRGADNTWFWIVKSPHKHPQVILFVGCNSLEILNTRTNGYNYIRSRWSSPSGTTIELYHFVDGEYRRWKLKLIENKK